MSALPVAPERHHHLPTLIDRAAAALCNARNAAEVLEAREMAAFAYDIAKHAARLGRAKQAHDELIAAAHRAQADALEIEAQAKRRLADEYDAARERGEVAGHGGGRNFKGPEGNVEKVVTSTDLGLTRKEIHEARLVRDAEEAEPGIVRRALDDRLEAGEEPSKAALRKMVVDAAMRGLRGDGRTRNPDPNPNPAFHPVAGVDGFGTTVADHVSAENEVVPAANLSAFQTGRPGTLSPTEGSETGRTVPPRNIEMG